VRVAGWGKVATGGGVDSVMAEDEPQQDERTGWRIGDRVLVLTARCAEAIRPAEIVRLHPFSDGRPTDFHVKFGSSLRYTYHVEASRLFRTRSDARRGLVLALLTDQHLFDLHRYDHRGYASMREFQRAERRRKADRVRRAKKFRLSVAATHDTAGIWQATRDAVHAMGRDKSWRHPFVVIDAPGGARMAWFGRDGGLWIQSDAV